MLFSHSRFWTGRVIFAVVLAVLLLQPQTGSAFTAIYAFGDSLTDTGRHPANSQYYQGRYSNGPLWIDYLSAMLGIPFNASNNFAYAGSTTSNLSVQVAEMPPLTNLQSALFAVWSGPNDFLLAGDYGTNDAAWAGVISNAVSNITNAIRALYTTNGAREFLVGNLIPITETPLFASADPVALTYIAAKVQLFNSQLGAAVTNLMQSTPGLRIYFMDDSTLWNTVYNSPSNYGFTVISAAALLDTNLPDKSFTGPGANYMFWDDAHPTTKFHAMLGTLAFDQVGVQLRLAASGTNLNLTVTNLYPGLPYTVQSSTNLLTWSNYNAFTASAINRSLAVTNQPGQKRYYRVQY